MIAEAFAQIRVALLRRGDVEGLGFGDERADPIDLRSAFDGAGNSGNDLLDPVVRERACGDRFTPRRLFVEPGNVHVTIAREQQRARDRCCRHHQKLGTASAPLGLQRQTLMHAEAMLLVDNDHSEVVKSDALLEQRVGADQNVDLPLAQGCEYFLALLAALAPRK